MSTQIATRDEITTWVNPDAWDDADEAARVIDAIEASGTDDEAEWVRIAGGGPDDVLDAALRHHERSQAVADESDERLRAAMRAARAAGMTKVELSRRTGMTRPTVDKWLAQ